MKMKIGLFVIYVFANKNSTFYEYWSKTFRFMAVTMLLIGNGQREIKLISNF